jgi:ubiquinone/menaquinone biosynthesis C-methylase UbiE
MGLKQKTMKAMVVQFRRPHGLGGRAAGWVMAHRGSNRARNKWAAGLLDVQPEDRVLEIGFGPGIAIEEMARRATRGAVVGLDHSDVMVRQATRRNAAAVRAGRVELGLGSAEDLPAFDDPFDRILAVNSLMFWDDPVAGLKELRGLLRPEDASRSCSSPEARDRPTRPRRAPVRTSPSTSRRPASPTCASRRSR